MAGSCKTARFFLADSVTSALPQAGSRRIFVRTFVQTTIFIRKNTNYASIFDFLRLNLAYLKNL